MIKAYNDSPTFYTGQELAAGDINILRDNAIILDALSYRNAWVTESNYVRERWPLSAANNPLTFWRGGFQFRTGLTIVVFSISMTLTGNETYLRIFFDDVQVYENTSLSNGTLNITINLSGLTDYQIVKVDVKMGFSVTTNKNGSYYVVDAYTAGYGAAATAILGSLPGIPTFGAISATNLNNLANTADWLMNKMALVPYVHTQTVRFWNGTHKVETFAEFWYGSAQQANGASILKVDVDYYIYNQSETLRLLVNGTSVATAGPFTSGQSGTVTLSYDLAALGTSKYIAYIDTVVSSGNSGFQHLVNSRYSLRNWRIVRNTNSYATSPIENISLESLRFDTLQARLNAIGTILSDVNTRMANNPIVFNRGKLFRSRFNNDGGHQNTKFEDLCIAENVRIGNVLWVRGKNIRIAYGPISMNSDLSGPSPQPEDLYKFEFEETLVEGDVYQSKKFYLDQFKGLFPGMTYHIVGQDIIYAAEHLR